MNAVIGDEKMRIVALNMKWLFLRDRVHHYKSVWPVLKRYQSDDRESGKTTVSVLNKQQEAGLLLNAFSQYGFRLNNDVSVIGPIAIFPQTILSWKVSDVRAITVESLSLFYVLEPKLDILVIGVGDKGNKIDPSVVQFLTQKKKIYVEVLPTEQACTTFNFLCAENRHVAGAMIPPYTIVTEDTDIISTKIRKRRLFEMGSSS